MPRVSVVLPTYNRLSTLKRALTSVLEQSYTDLEVIVVDDCSQDGTRAYVEALSDTRIRYRRHKVNKGASAARNTGIKAARGNYIGFQDSDDVWLPDKLAKQVAPFEVVSPRVGVVYTGFYAVEGEKKTYKPDAWVTQTDEDIHTELLRGNFVGTPCALVKRECFERLGGFDETLSSLEDWDLWLKLSRHYHFAYVAEPLLMAFQSPGGVNAQAGLARAVTLRKILTKHYDSFSTSRKSLARLEYLIGNLTCQFGDFSEGRKALAEAWASDKTSLKYSSAYLLACSGRKPYKTLLNFKRSLAPGKATNRKAVAS